MSFNKFHDLFTESVEDGFTEIFDKFRKDYIQTVLETKTAMSILVVIELRDLEMTTVVVPLESEKTIPDLAKRYAKQTTKYQTSLPIAIMTAGEAWCKMYKDESEYDGLTENGQPKEGVEEALIISGLTCTRKSSSTVYNIIRDDKDIQDLVDSGMNDGEPRMLIKFYELLGGEMDKLTRSDNGTKAKSKAN